MMDAGQLTEDLLEFLDRANIRACLERLAHGEDRRNAEIVSGSWWPDAKCDFGMFCGDFPAYLAWVVPGSDAVTNTQHVLGQSIIELQGKTARCETYVISYHRTRDASGENDSCIGGRYLDVMEKRAGVWRIANRTMLYDWLQDWGRSADWSRGVPGMPFSNQEFSGKAHGDYSERFFGNSSHCA